MGNGITYVGLDAHKKSISVAVLLPRRKRPEEWTIANEPQAVRRLVRKLEKAAPGKVRCCYEAGPLGYALQRSIEGAGKRTSCEVVAPSLIPVKPGERIKTDRRDAKKLAGLLRANLLTEVHAPTEKEEAVRDLVRCRDDARDDLIRARHRLSKMLLRRGLRFPGTNWTQKHMAWLRQIDWEHEAEKTVFQDYLQAIELIGERMKKLDAKIAEIALEGPYAEPVAWLRCFRGIDTLSAMILVAELHDFRRFQSARALMAYLGLVPGEHSSADTRKRRSITRTGNKLVRRILIEAAKHYSQQPRVGVSLRKRQEGQPVQVTTMAWRAQSRLHRKYWRLVHGRNKSPNKATVALARELAGFIWGVLFPQAQAAV